MNRYHRDSTPTLLGGPQRFTLHGSLRPCPDIHVRTFADVRLTRRADLRRQPFFMIYPYRAQQGRNVCTYLELAASINGLHAIHVFATTSAISARFTAAQVLYGKNAPI
jgi:hypothetical protein